MKKIVFVLAMLVAWQGVEAKSLVAYFSVTGTTKAAAERLAAEHGSSLWRIEEFEPYTEADLNWRDSTCRTRREAMDTFERPMIKICTWIEPYDTIYLGFPIWYGTCPRIIQSWVENNILDGKVMIPFATSGGSTIDRAVAFLRKRYAGYDWRDGVML